MHFADPLLAVIKESRCILEIVAGYLTRQDASGGDFLAVLTEHEPDFAFRG
jgi:hypothetical protein